jgi:hypothetical protein
MVENTLAYQAAVTATTLKSFIAQAFQETVWENCKKAETGSKPF